MSLRIGDGIIFGRDHKRSCICGLGTCFDTMIKLSAGGKNTSCGYFSVPRAPKELKTKPTKESAELRASRSFIRVLLCRHLGVQEKDLPEGPAFVARHHFHPLTLSACGNQTNLASIIVPASVARAVNNDSCSYTVHDQRERAASPDEQSYFPVPNYPLQRVRSDLGTARKISPEPAARTPPPPPKAAPGIWDAVSADPQLVRALSTGFDDDTAPVPRQSPDEKKDTDRMAINPQGAAAELEALRLQVAQLRASLEAEQTANAHARAAQEARDQDMEVVVQARVNALMV